MQPIGWVSQCCLRMLGTFAIDVRNLERAPLTPKVHCSLPLNASCILGVLLSDANTQ